MEDRRSIPLTTGLSVSDSKFMSNLPDPNQPRPPWGSQPPQSGQPWGNQPLPQPAPWTQPPAVFQPAMGFVQPMYDATQQAQYEQAKASRRNVNALFITLMAVCLFGGAQTFGIMWVLMIPVGIVWALVLAAKPKAIQPKPVGYQQQAGPNYYPPSPPLL